MRMEYLRTLQAVHRTGSVSAAAREVHLSDSAVSVQLRKLEEELGKELTQKGKRPLSLTGFGIQFCELSARVVESHDALLRFARDDIVEGQVRIGFVSTTLQTLLPRILTALGQEFPMLEVRILSGLSQELSDQVRAGKLDFAFVSSAPRANSGIQTVEIAHEPLRLIASPGLRERPDAGALFRQRPFIGFARNTWLGLQIQEILTTQFPDIEQTVELDSIDAIENLVACDQGISIVPERIFAVDLRERFHVADLPGPQRARSLQLISAANCVRDRVRRQMIDTCTAQSTLEDEQRLGDI